MCKIKTIYFLFILSFMILSKIGFSEEGKIPKPIFSIKLARGVSYAATGDMNKHLNSINNYENRPGGYATDVSGEIEKLNNKWLSDWEVELRIDISPKIGLGLATSTLNIQRSNQSSIYAYEVPESGRDYEMIFKPEIQAKNPLILSFYYSVYSSSRLNIFINSGIGWYWGKMKEDKMENAIYPLGDIYFDNRYWEVENKFSLGFLGGVQLEYSLIKNLALVVELQGRYIRIGNLKGTVKYETNYGGGMTFEESGALHFFSYSYYYDLDIPLPGHIDNLINEKDIERKAVLDLSGLSLRIGIRIKLI